MASVNKWYVAGLAFSSTLLIAPQLNALHVRGWQSVIDSVKLSWWVRLRQPLGKCFKSSGGRSIHQGVNIARRQ